MPARFRGLLGMPLRLGVVLLLGLGAVPGIPGLGAPKGATAASLSAAGPGGLHSSAHPLDAEKSSPHALLRTTDLVGALATRPAARAASVAPAHRRGPPDHRPTLLGALAGMAGGVVASALAALVARRPLLRPIAVRRIRPSRAPPLLAVAC